MKAFVLQEVIGVLSSQTCSDMLKMGSSPCEEQQAAAGLEQQAARGLGFLQGCSGWTAAPEPAQEPRYDRFGSTSAQRLLSSSSSQETLRCLILGHVSKHFTAPDNFEPKDQSYNTKRCS